jgi:hypothetical protein
MPVLGATVGAQAIASIAAITQAATIEPISLLPAPVAATIRLGTAVGLQSDVVAFPVVLSTGDNQFTALKSTSNVQAQKLIL